MFTIRKRSRPRWPEFIGSYGLWAVALVLGGLGVMGLGQ
jgi:hypothetical protein